jgi:23S rRNA pseudouridine1911/1915/1917 synthase
LVEGRRLRSSDRLRGGELIRVELSAAVDPTVLPEAIPLRLAYEDETMLIVDKPAGMVVHPSAGHAAGTLVNALLGRAQNSGQRLGSIAGVERAGIVHRLDRDTSGLLLVAKTDSAQASLADQFARRSIEKEYVALVRGAPPATRGRIEAPIGRDPRERQRMAVVLGGREAVTEYEVLASTPSHALLSLRPLTGRTHQIRAHLAYIGMPVVGDARYGGGIGPGGLRRQFLHAMRLRLRRPIDDAWLEAWSELPPDLSAALAAVALESPRLARGVGARSQEE